MTIKAWSSGVFEKLDFNKLGLGRWLAGRKSASQPPRSTKSAIPSSPKRVSKHVANQGSAFISPKSAKGLVNQLSSTGRYMVLLLPKVIDNLLDRQLIEVIDILNREMSLIPEGAVAVERGYIGEEPDVTTDIVAVEKFFLDRFAVTNAEFKRFVSQGGYQDVGLWDAEVLPAIAEFVDDTGQPGPRGWKDGAFPPDKSEHPVVGVCWHEANAYARWVGKRLPTNAEWVKAASWPLVTDGKPTRQRTYPWGNIFEESNANVWVTGLNHTVRVDEFQNGNNASDVCQLSGNVWEWMADDFSVYSGTQVVTAETATKSLRGGAFDTYVERQASCQFESGDHPFARKGNIGFRCAMSMSALATEARVKISQLGITAGPVKVASILATRPSETDDLDRRSPPKREAEPKKSDADVPKKRKSRFAGPGDIG